MAVIELKSFIINDELNGKTTINVSIRENGEKSHRFRYYGINDSETNWYGKYWKTYNGVNFTQDISATIKIVNLLKEFFDRQTLFEQKMANLRRNYFNI